MPVVRSPAQLAAARRNGALSRGPVTPEGKARSRANALRHGLAALEHLLIEHEDPAAYEALLADLVAEIEPETGIEACLVQRLASAIWRQQRADRLEQKLFRWAPPAHVFVGAKSTRIEPEAAFDLARFATVRRYQSGLQREVLRLMAEIRRLRAERATTEMPEPAPVPAPGIPDEAPNEPGPGAEPSRAGASPRAPAKPEPPAPTPRGNVRNEPGSLPVDGAPNEPEPCQPNRHQRRRLEALRRAAA